MLLGNDYYFLFVLQLVLFLCLWEFLRVVKFYLEQEKSNKKIHSNFLLTRKKLGLNDFLLIFSINFANIYFFYTQLEFPLILLVILLFFVIRQINNFKVFLGLIYFSAPFFFLIYYKLNTNFSFFFSFVILFSVATDVGAYIFVKTIGGKKLMKTVSPNKTISGMFGGIFVSTILCLFIFYKIVDFPSIIVWCVIFSLTVQAGDLLESQMKRVCSIKDSSKLIPGHGGVLDRLDGVFLLISFVSILNLLGFNFFFII